MATFIKNNCECCQPAVCESCEDPCANTITTTKQFLAPGSEPQEGVILLSDTITVQLANIQIRPCGCDYPDPFSQVPCTSGLCDPYLCEACEANIATELATLYDPKVLEYEYTPFVPYMPGYKGGGCVYAAPPNTIFVLGDFNNPFPFPNAGGVYIGNAPYGVCDGYGQYFYSCGLIAETENSLTYAGGIGYPYSSGFPPSSGFMQGSGGTATITW
jgi:hypothetical protein